MTSFDLMTAVRGLAATPVPVGAAILTLAVSAGLNVAMFGLIDRAFLSPPAHVSDPSGVVKLAFAPPDDDLSNARMTTTSYVDFRAIRDNVPAFSDVAAWQRASLSVMANGEQLRADAMIVSGSYFRLLGAHAIVGRAIAPEDDREAAGSPVAVLSHAFWSSAFARDRAILGRRLTIRGTDYTIAGVMPASFSGHSSTRVDVWLPFAAAMRGTPNWDRDRYRNIASLIGRLAPGANASAAEVQGKAVVDRRVILSPIVGADMASNDAQIGWWLVGMSTVVFVAGLANAGTLLLVRGVRRRHEMAIRGALGATRGRLMRQTSAEAVVLSIAAAAVALLLAQWFDDLVRRGLFSGVIESTGVGRRTMLAGGAVALVTALTAGVANLLPIRDSAGTGIGIARGGYRRTRSMTVLLVLQTAMSVVLLAGAGLFASSFYKLAGQDFGMRMGDVLVVDYEMGPSSSMVNEDLFAVAIDGVRSLPGVELASLINTLPFTGHNVPPISVPGRAEPPNVGGQLPFLTAATPELFRILGVRLVEGRSFTPADDRGALVVIVNHTMARLVWPGESAIGKCIRIGFDPGFDPATASGPPTPSDKVTCRQVIGVVNDVRQRSLLPDEGEDHLMQYYVPLSQVPRPPFAGANAAKALGLVLRASVPASTLAPSIRRLVVDGRSDVPYVRVRRYSDLLDRQIRPWRVGTAMLTLFGALALGVAALGLYAAFAHAVVERRREMAIRLAVGAEPARVVRMIVLESSRLTLIGIAAGTAAAVAAGRWLQSWLFQTEPADPLVLAAAAIVMLTVSVISTFVPAFAAGKNDPAILLRCE